MFVRRFAVASSSLLRNQGISNIQCMSSKSGGTGRRIVKSSVSKKRRDDSIVPAAAADPWVEVLDKASGQVYFWNQTTDETTALGAPKPNGSGAVATQQEAPQGGMMSGLGGVVAQGFAFGVGSSIAHSVVGSMFGGGSSHPSDGGGGGGGGGGDDSSFDI